MGMNTHSKKAKGRRLQKWVVEKILAVLPSLASDDVSSRSMGAGGEDVLLSPKARSLFPYSIECKNTERVNVWNFYEQALSNSNSSV